MSWCHTAASSPWTVLTMAAGKVDASQEKVQRQKKAGISREEPGRKNPRKPLLGEELPGRNLRLQINEDIATSSGGQTFPDWLPRYQCQLPESFLLE